MKYTIASDIPGRIRVRCGPDAFTMEEGQGIVSYMAAVPYVSTVSVSHLTGSILVCYEKPRRQEVLDEVRGLAPHSLAIPPRELWESAVEHNLEFQRSLLNMAAVRLFSRYVLPAPIRIAISVKRALTFLKKGLVSLRNGKVGVDVLDAAAVWSSLLQGNYDTASSIIFLLRVSDLLEDYTRKRTKDALAESLSIYVDSVWLARGGEQILIPMSQLCTGDEIVIRTGSLIPVDGEVSRGEAMVNQSSMTGEPLAVLKREGDTVFAGTVLEDGELVVRVRTLGSDTRISQIVRLIDQSEALKAGIQGKAESIADKIVPYNFLLAGLVFALTRNITKATSVLLVDYSCAIKLTTPISIISAMREAADHRIMVKGGKFLEVMATADTIVFDKTGTLTHASPTVNKVVSFGAYAPSEVLRISACLEEHFPHSVARAVVKKAVEEGLSHEEMHSEVEYIVAHGIATAIEGKRAIIGSEHFVFDDEHVPYTRDQRALVKDEVGGDSVIFLAIDGEAVGFICIHDPPRREAETLIRGLKRLGIENILMLTGDSDATASLVSQSLGITQYRSQVLPEDKAAIIEELKNQGRTVVMVGDGINDSPALAAAHASVSMKDSSDIAREVADITLLSSDLSDLITLRLLSRALMNRIRGNYRFIILFNSTLLALGLGGVITASTSALLHNASTMAISAGSMRKLLAAREEGEETS